MPAIGLPDIRELRRGIRFGDVRDRAEDARRATGEVGLPNIDWSKLDPSRFDFSKIDFSKLDLPARAELAKQVRKASKDQLRRASKEINRNLPGRRTSRMPFAMLGVIGGIFVGWILATTPSARRAIEQAVGSLREAASGAIAGMTTPTSDREEADLAAWTRESGTPVASDTYAAAIGAQRQPVTSEAGVGVGPGNSSNEVPSQGDLG